MKFIVLIIWWGLIASGTVFAQNNRLNGMPLAKEVIDKIKGKSKTQTLQLQIGVFRILRACAKGLTDGGSYQFGSDESKLVDEYLMKENLLTTELVRKTHNNNFSRVDDYANSDSLFNVVLNTLVKPPAQKIIKERIVAYDQNQEHRYQYEEQRKNSRIRNYWIGMLVGILVFILSIFVMISGFRTLRRIGDLEFYGRASTPNQQRGRIVTAMWGRTKVTLGFILFFAGIGIFFMFAADSPYTANF